MGRKTGLQTMDGWVDRQYGQVSGRGSPSDPRDRLVQAPQENRFFQTGSVKEASTAPLNYGAKYDAVSKYMPDGGATINSRRAALWDYAMTTNPQARSVYGNTRQAYVAGNPALLGRGQKTVLDFQNHLRNGFGAEDYDNFLNGVKPTPLAVQQPTQAMLGANADMGASTANMVKPEAFADGGMVGLGTSGMQQQPQTLLALRYADGGQVGGQPGMAPPGAEEDDNPQMVEMRINDMMRDNPDRKAQIQQVVAQAMQEAQITPEEANMVVQYAKACMQNPALWPQIRQFAIQQGIDPNILPQQYDRGLVYSILVAAQAMQDEGGMNQMQNAQAYANGGMILGPGTGRSDSIDTVNQSTGQPVKVSNGEYIIPAHVVEAKGKDFFDSLLRKYAPIKQGGEQ